MTVNTAYMDDGQFTTGSSFSAVASRATVKAQDVVATSVLSTAALTVQNAGTYNGAATFASTVSVAGAVTMQSTAQVRSALTAVGWLYASVFISSSTTAQSLVTSKVSQQGQIAISILSLTSNGAQMGVRSGNTVYIFESTAQG